jgi:hypothetical protein
VAPSQGEAVGPYISQFFITPTFFGQQPISQQQVTYQQSVDYLTDSSSWALIQNGGSTGLQNQNAPQLSCVHSGRDLSAWTHTDVLYQGYFVAFLVLNTIGAPANPGSPYSNSKTQVGFATFGGPYIAGMLGEVAYRALERSWFQKWFVHRRHRPESGGGIVHLTKTGQGSSINGSLNDNVLNSQAVQSSFDKYGTYLLSQAFPEGSPTHPSYPTGHGVVAGACVTILKFFFDGNFVIPNPQVPTEDGLALVPYTGSDRNQITVNSELNKLAHNITFGHGIHAGIHWRSDSDVSMVLGEATAISFLRTRRRRLTRSSPAILPSSTGLLPPSPINNVCMPGGPFNRAVPPPSSCSRQHGSLYSKSDIGSLPLAPRRVSGSLSFRLTRSVRRRAALIKWGSGKPRPRCTPQAGPFPGIHNN